MSERRRRDPGDPRRRGKRVPRQTPPLHNAYIPVTADPPWERQPGEPDQAYAAFQVYLSQGRTRTHQQTASEQGLSTAYISSLAKFGSWAGRVAAWDDWRDRKETDEIADLLRGARKGRAAVSAHGMRLALKSVAAALSPTAEPPTAAEGARWATVAGSLLRDADATALAAASVASGLHPGTDPNELVKWVVEQLRPYPDAMRALLSGLTQRRDEIL